ncbi:MAG: RluA family pseudouridine synthase [Eubacteriales bacterium]|nr:RluA family pseudouridine synthase [Eubacteriales bacterium]
MHEPEVLYEDNHVIVAIKPAGYLSQADSSDSPDMLSWLKTDLKERYQKPGEVFLGLVHRLDQPVSGIMVFAKTSKAAARLSEQIRNHQLGKYYLAVVEHRPVPEQGCLEDYLLKDKSQNQVAVCTPGKGQYAMLNYTVLAFDLEHNCSLVRIELGTGRSHQIRVQFASRGWPLVGDRRYGSRVQSNKKPTGENQLALFAERLTFKHPTRDEIIDLLAPRPLNEPWSYFSATTSPAFL